MRVAFVGKGGSGKTTLAALFARYLAARGFPVVAVDADINQHLGVALGLSEDDVQRLPGLGGHLGALKDHLRGSNPRVNSADDMVKTTPPGRGSRLLRLTEDDPVLKRFERAVGGVRLLVTGAFEDTDLGVSCYHSKTGAAELWLNHLIDGRGEYVVLDMTAGADAFASGLFTRFDLTILVSEPTRRGVGVYRQYRDYASGYEVDLRVVGNKVTGADDIDYLQRSVGNALLGWLHQSAYLRAAERGDLRALTELEPANIEALDQICSALDSTDKDWRRYHQRTVEFHLRNAAAWGGNRAADLLAQVDPDFVPDPSLLDALV